MQNGAPFGPVSGLCPRGTSHSGGPTGGDGAGPIRRGPPSPPRTRRRCVFAPENNGRRPTARATVWWAAEKKLLPKGSPPLQKKKPAVCGGVARIIPLVRFTIFAYSLATPSVAGCNSSQLHSGRPPPDHGGFHEFVERLVDLVGRDVPWLGDGTSGERVRHQLVEQMDVAHTEYAHGLVPGLGDRPGVCRDGRSGDTVIHQIQEGFKLGPLRRVVGKNVLYVCHPLLSVARGQQLEPLAGRAVSPPRSLDDRLQKIRRGTRPLDLHRFDEKEHSKVVTHGAVEAGGGRNPPGHSV